MEQETASRTSRIWLLGIGVLCCVLIICAAALAFAVARGNSAAIPAAIRSQVAFPIYYPKDSPNNFVIHKQEIRYDANAAILQFPAINTVSNHYVSVNEQAMPAKLSFDALKGEGTVIDGAPGQAAISNVEGRMVASIISPDGKTLIILNSTDATNQELTALVKSFQLVR